MDASCLLARTRRLVFGGNGSNRFIVKVLKCNYIPLKSDMTFIHIFRILDSLACNGCSWKKTPASF